MNSIVRSIATGLIGIALGAMVSWMCLRHLPPKPPTSTPIPIPVEKQSVAVGLIDLLTTSAQSPNPEKTTRYTQALAALGPEALPEIRQRLKDPLTPQAQAAVAAALVEAGGEKTLPEVRALWPDLKIKLPLVIALSKHRTPDVAQCLLDLWLAEKDPEAQKLLLQALQTNPQTVAPLAAKAWDHVKDEDQKTRLQGLMGVLTLQAHLQEESRDLFALKPSTEARQVLKTILDRPGTDNKSMAIGKLEQDGSVEALQMLFVYAQKETQAGLRFQALVPVCRKADASQAGEVAAWYAQDEKARQDILNALGNCNNPVFLPFVSGLEGSQARRVRELLVMAENRRKVGLKQ